MIGGSDQSKPEGEVIRTRVSDLVSHVGVWCLTQAFVNGYMT